MKSIDKEAGMLSMTEAHEGWAMVESERKGESQLLLLSHHVLKVSDVSLEKEIIATLKEGAHGM